MGSDEKKICRYCGKRVNWGPTRKLTHPKEHHCDYCDHRTHHGCLAPEDARTAYGIKKHHVCWACMRERVGAQPARTRSGCLRIAVVADAHLASWKDMLRDGKVSAKEFGALFEHKKYSRRATMTLLEEVRRANPDHILFAGDATINGTKAEIEDANRYFQASFGDMSLIAVPGNHDFWSVNHAGGATLLGMPLRREDYPIISRLPTGLNVVALCTPDPPFNLVENAKGLVGQEQLEKLDEELHRLDDANERAIVLMHHPCRHNDQGLLKLRDSSALTDVLDSHPSAALAVAGHVHKAWLCSCGCTRMLSCPSVAEDSEFVTFNFDVGTGEVSDLKLFHWVEERGIAQAQLGTCGAS